MWDERPVSRRDLSICGIHARLRDSLHDRIRKEAFVATEITVRTRERTPPLGFRGNALLVQYGTVRRCEVLHHAARPACSFEKLGFVSGTSCTALMTPRCRYGGVVVNKRRPVRPPHSFPRPGLVIALINHWLGLKPPVLICTLHLPISQCFYPVFQGQPFPLLSLNYSFAEHVHSAWLRV